MLILAASIGARRSQDRVTDSDSEARKRRARSADMDG
jgi:hypothetical protein